jgi:hypothetical protein
MNFPVRSLKACLLVALLSPSVGAFNLPKVIKTPANDAAVTSADNGLKAATIENDWTSVSEMIHSKISAAEAKEGTPLTEEAKDEIIATALAGSVLGTAVGSPLLIGAALGYAGSQLLQGEKGEKTRQMLGKASKDLLEQAQAAVAFTQEQLEEEKDLSKVSKKILLAIQAKASDVQNDFKSSPSDMVERLKDNLKKTVESEDFKSLPNRSFQAVRAFVESEEVKKASSSVVQAIKDGLESEEMKALQSRASQAINDSMQSKKQ